MPGVEHPARLVDPDLEAGGLAIIARYTSGTQHVRIASSPTKAFNAWRRGSSELSTLKAVYYRQAARPHTAGVTGSIRVSPTVGTPGILSPQAVYQDHVSYGCPDPWREEQE